MKSRVLVLRVTSTRVRLPHRVQRQRVEAEGWGSEEPEP
jgi:hypothetical protein